MTFTFTPAVLFELIPGKFSFPLQGHIVRHLWFVQFHNYFQSLGWREKKFQVRIPQEYHAFFSAFSLRWETRLTKEVSTNVARAWNCFFLQVR